MTLTEFMVNVVFGLGSVLAIIYLYRHADDLSDGNVGADE